MKRVYYFTSEDYALSNIDNERIKISLLDELNDPYEFLGVDISDKEFRKSFNAGRDEAKKNGWLNLLFRVLEKPTYVGSLRR